MAPQLSYAQSEDDILNSIGDELDAEAAEKEKKEKLEAEYKDLKSKADGSYKGKKYEKAKEYYQQMAKLMPDREYASRQIQLIDQQLAELKEAETEKKYKAFIAKADELLAKEKWDDAKLQYLEASKVRPSESYPKEKVKEIGQLKAKAAEAAKQAEIQKKYDGFIAEADKLLAQKQWDNAKAKYVAAAKLKPEEKYPKDQQVEIARLKKEEEERKKQEAAQKKYDALIAEADKLLGQKQWDNAKAKYQQASTVKPDEAYPKTQLAKVDQLRAEEEERQKQAAADAKYKALIAEADKQFQGKNWDAAKSKYEEAKQVKPSESYPTAQIQAVEAARKAEAEAAEQAKIDQQYQALIKEADGLFQQKQWDAAIAKYQAAQQVKASETYPKQQITAAESSKKAEAEAAAQAEIDQKYQTAIQAADDLFKQKQWDGAIAKYQEAQGIKSAEAYPGKQIAAAEASKKAEADAAAQAEIDQQYQAAIQAADDLFKQKQWDGAIAKYQEAQGIKSAEAYPGKQIAAAEASKKAEADAAAQAEIDQQYQAAIQAADDLFQQKQWDGAIAKYQEAQGIKSAEAYPGKQIAAAEAGKKAEADAAAQAEIDQTYQAVIQAADDLFQQKQWDGAIAKYQEAQGIKSAEAYPGKQIAAAEAGKKAEAQAAIDEQYDAVISEADGLFQQEQWDAAIAKYQEAQAIKASESYPKEQITTAQTRKQEAASAAEKAALRKQHDQLVREADEFFNQKQWQSAIDKYDEAHGVFPDENYTTAQIEKARKFLKEEASQAELDAQFASLLEKGDAALAGQQWEGAIQAYSDAGKLKPGDPVAQEKLTEAKNAKQQALDNAAAAEEQAKVDQEYQQAIQEGDATRDAKDWTNARAFYTKASNLKPDESYPPEQLAQIDQLEQEEAAALQEAKEAEELAAQQAAEQYQSLLTTGEAAIAASDWAAARQAFQQAATLKPEAEVPGEKLAEIDRLEAMAAAEQAQIEAAAAAEEQRKAEFAGLVQQADEAASAENYVEAKSLYSQASAMYPEEQYPVGKIAEMERLILEQEEAIQLAAAEEQRKREELDARYSEVMAKAEAAAFAKNWNEAIDLFKEAQSVKPDAQGPAERIADMEKLIAKEEAERQREADQTKRAQELENEYNGLIAQADQAVENQNWGDAREYYGQALKLKPEETYPKDRIEQVAVLQKQAEAEALAAAEAEAQRKAEEEARLQAEEQARKQAEAEAQARAAAQAEKETRFQDALQRGDNAMATGNFGTAVAAFEEAEQIMPESPELGQRLADARAQLADKQQADAEKAQAREAERQKELEAARKQAAELAEQRRKERIARMLENSPEELAKRYPSGLSQEVIDEGYRTITKSVIVEDGLGRQLLKLDYPWGQEFYYLNGKPVTGDAYHHNIRNYQ